MPIWLPALIVAIFGFTAFNFANRFASKHFDPAVGAMLISLMAFIVSCGYIALTKPSSFGQVFTDKYILLAMAVFAVLNFVGIAAYVTAFSKGASLSGGGVVLNTSIVLLVFAGGILFYKEPVTMTKLLGLLLSCTGIYLVMR